MPPVPELPYIRTYKRLVEVFGCFYTQYITYTYGHQAVTGKIEEKIPPVKIHVSKLHPEPAYNIDLGYVRDSLIQKRCDDKFVHQPETYFEQACANHIQIFFFRRYPSDIFFKSAASVDWAC